MTGHGAASGRIAAAGLLLLLPLLAGASSRAKPGEAAQDEPVLSDRERYIELYRRKQRAEQLNALWKLEVDLAAKRTAYAVLDLSERKLLFKVRGRTFKAVSFSSLESSRGAIDHENLAWRAFTLEIKHGKGVETESIQSRSLTDAEARSAGVEGSEGEPIGAEQGAIQEGTDPSGSASGSDADSTAQKTAGVAGGSIPPDPPPKYHMGFDGDLSIWVVADEPPKSISYERLLSLAKQIGRLFVGADPEARKTSLMIRLPLDRAQQIYRQLLPGQRLLITG